jgi:hypothetical protein
MSSFLNQSYTYQPDEDDGDNSNWVPLDQQDEVQVLEPPIVVVSTANPRPSLSPASNPSQTRRTSANDDNDEAPNRSMRMLQRKLETNTKLKQGLVDHPLDQAWLIFVVHLGRELWELDLRIRLGMRIIVESILPVSVPYLVLSSVCNLTCV